MKAFAFAGSAATCGLALLAPAAAWAQPGGWFGGPHMWNGGWGMFFGPLMWILVVAAVAALVAYLIRSSGGGARTTGAGRTPLDILDERFARGEIDEKEYRERKKVLKG